MLVVPKPTPVTTPDAFTVAIDGSIPSHMPPVDVVLSVVVSPSHTVAVPVIVAGSGFTTTVAVVKQPVGSV